MYTKTALSEDGENVQKFPFALSPWPFFVFVKFIQVHLLLWTTFFLEKGQKISVLIYLHSGLVWQQDLVPVPSLTLPLLLVSHGVIHCTLSHLPTELLRGAKKFPLFGVLNTFSVLKLSVSVHWESALLQVFTKCCSHEVGESEGNHLGVFLLWNLPWGDIPRGWAHLLLQWPLTAHTSACIRAQAGPAAPWLPHPTSAPFPRPLPKAPCAQETWDVHSCRKHK